MQQQESVPPVAGGVVLLLGDAGAGQRLVEQPVQLGPQALLDRIGARRRGGVLDVDGEDVAVDGRRREAGASRRAGPGWVVGDVDPGRVVTSWMLTETGW